LSATVINLDAWAATHARPGSHGSHGSRRAAPAPALSDLVEVLALGLPLALWLAVVRACLRGQSHG
jgi:hypothetical protein